MPGKSGDVFEVWRSLVQQWETQANATLNETTGNQKFGREMNRYLTTGLQMQNAFNEAVEKGLAALNLPSRGEIARLGEKLDSIDRKLDRLLEAQQLQPVSDSGRPTPKPARSRRPPDPT